LLENASNNQFCQIPRATVLARMLSSLVIETHAVAVVIVFKVQNLFFELRVSGWNSEVQGT
jgi:hypothetical protein